MLFTSPFWGQFWPPSSFFRHAILAREKNNFVDCCFVIIVLLRLSRLIGFHFFFLFYGTKKKQIVIHAKFQKKSGSYCDQNAIFESALDAEGIVWINICEGDTLFSVLTSLRMLKLECRYIPTLHAILAHRFGTYMERGSRSSDGVILAPINGVTNTIGVYPVNGNKDCC